MRVLVIFRSYVFQANACSVTYKIRCWLSITPYLNWLGKGHWGMEFFLARKLGGIYIRGLWIKTPR